MTRMLMYVNHAMIGIVSAATFANGVKQWRDVVAPHPEPMTPIQFLVIGLFLVWVAVTNIAAALCWLDRGVESK